jgi:hypothetical protein
VTRAERSINAMERLAEYAGFRLQIYMEKNNSEWIMRFVAGKTNMWCKVDVFQRNPYAIIDAFGEALIKEL